MLPAHSGKKKPGRPETELQKCHRQLQFANDSLGVCRKELEACQREHQEAERANREKDTQISRLGTELTSLAQKNLELTGALEKATAERPSMSIDELVEQLRTSLGTLNDEARQRSQPGKAQFMVDQFEVEIKASIDLKEGLRLTQLQGQEISPQSASTIRFALKPVPVITIVDDSPPNK